MIRCCNLDWLEVDVLEYGAPHTPDYFREHGHVVTEREYGTRVWGQMFIVHDEHGEPFVEVRRAPKTMVIAAEETHLRFVNRYCYMPDAATIMQRFIESHEYLFQRIVRIDIALDFAKFDQGDDPAKFLDRYLRRKYSKINQANVHSHGTDTWSAREWNSISWGSPTSDVGTKFYNKTLELYDPIKKCYGKSYIRQQWQAAGLVDDWHLMTKNKADGTKYTPVIWRVEFSIRSSVKKWYVIHPNGKEKVYQSIRNTLEVYDSPQKILTMFAMLSCHYFHFKQYIPGKRKDRCPDKVLFDWHGMQEQIKIAREQLTAGNKPSSWLLRLISALRLYRDRTINPKTKEQITQLIKVLLADVRREEIGHHVITPEDTALRAVLRLKVDGDSTDPAQLLRDILQEMHLNPDTCPFY